MSKPEFTDAERTVLGIAQANLPDSDTPYADMAAAAGLTEQEVLDLLARLKDDGVIRRFGATLRHQKAGYGQNAMVAWIVPDERADEVGEFFAARPEISHCYRRVTYPEWPYNLYTMIHGKNPGDCAELAARLAEELDIPDYTILESVREFKKTSMAYFSDQTA
jgi:DNA-binding Lrp family transcriptional regulator